VPEHLADSIENPIPNYTVLANFAEEHHEELERVREEGDGFYAWGAVPGRQSRCAQKGDASCVRV
jgi:hypothetical protein